MSDTTSYMNSNYEVAIPPSVRKALDLSPGQKVDFIKLHGCLPPRSREAYRRGARFAQGQNQGPSRIREPDRIL